ncbi:TPA: hypothetical protein DF272_04435 [Candidatus Falkowbacteria bacterium]|nr:hypothetical protein [Candidatus Falkowbacteria bacterium]
MTATERVRLELEIIFRRLEIENIFMLPDRKSSFHELADILSSGYREQRTICQRLGVRDLFSGFVILMQRHGVTIKQALAVFTHCHLFGPCRQRAFEHYTDPEFSGIRNLIHSISSPELFRLRLFDELKRDLNSLPAESPEVAKIMALLT